MTTLLLYPLVSVALYYLGARALITRPLWSRYPAWFDGLMTCASCSGFWYNLGLAALFGYWKRWSFMGLPGNDPLTIGLVGLCGIVWTPVVAAVQIRALEMTGLVPAPAAVTGDPGQEKPRG